MEITDAELSLNTDENSTQRRMMQSQAPDLPAVTISAEQDCISSQVQFGTYLFSKARTYIPTQRLILRKGVLDCYI